jgi:CheY-like chemotaxis protein
MQATAKRTIRIMIVDDDPKRPSLIKKELESRKKIAALDNGIGDEDDDNINCYQVDVFSGGDNYKKALEVLETCSVDSPYSVVIANERLGLISGGPRTGLSGVYAESGLLFCYKLKNAYPCIVKATMVIAAIRGYTTLYGFYNAAILRQVLYSLGISGYITKPINSKNISRVIKKIEIVLEKQMQEEKKDPLLSLSYMSMAEWMEMNAESKINKLRKLIDNYIRRVQFLKADAYFYPFKSEEVHQEMVQQLRERITKSIEYVQQVVDALDRDILSEEKVLEPLFSMGIPDKKKPFEDMKENRQYAYGEGGDYFKIAPHHHNSNVYSDRIAKAKFNGAMEDIMRGLEYVACIEAEIKAFVANVIKVMETQNPETRMRMGERKELAVLKDLFDEIIMIRERLKDSIIYQQRQLRILSEELPSNKSTQNYG